MKKTLIDYNTVNNKIKEIGLNALDKATIREIVRLVNEVQKATGETFVRMEMGVPGLKAPQIGIQAEIDALNRGVASKYPMIEGIAVLKPEIKRFIKLFMNIDVEEVGCLPTVGAMQGAFATFLIAARTNIKKDTVLFIDPGFPVQKMQLDVLGYKYETFDVYDFRGDKLREKLESYFKKDNISSVIYSNPNNPSWICFTNNELKIIGELANKYDVIVIEDLAYFAMDFREDFSKPGEPPYQHSVANYTDNYLLLLSGSKAFSYAGQRIGMMAISPKLFYRRYPDLKRFFSSDQFGYAMIYGSLYTLSAGTSHSVQYGMAAMLKAANDGKFNFVDDVKEYGRRAKIMKKIFLNNGFTIVYDKDEDNPIADGFYFTFSYKDMTGGELLKELLYYGISAISLTITGSKRSEGLRACVSQISKSHLTMLENRLIMFNKDH